MSPNGLTATEFLYALPPQDNSRPVPFSYWEPASSVRRQDA